MRVALLSCNARAHNAVGNHVAEKVRFFQERGAEIRVFVEDARHLHPELRSCTREQNEATLEGSTWEYLQQADLLFAVYAQAYDLLQYLPRLAGTGPRIVFDYLGVTPAQFWRDQQREGIERTQRERGYVWCADHALTISAANKREFLDATDFTPDNVTTLPLAVDFEKLRPNPGCRYLQKKLNIDGRILLCVGRLAQNKRVPLLIEALARHEDRSLHVVLVGDCRDIYAEEAVRCMALAQELRVTDRVHFVGQLNNAELAQAYQCAEVLLVPSLHEGFCVPVIEAMAAGCPVIAARATALPETVADAGLTFAPDDADDLVRKIRRMLANPGLTGARKARRVAIASFRFGRDIVGGAESSLRTMACALQNMGYAVEVFTTCTQSESNWQNDLPTGSVSLDGLMVHRFPVDSHDHAAHGEIVRAITEAAGNVPETLESRYLAHSIHSQALVRALRDRQCEFDAIITGPYLFRLTADIVQEFPHKTLVVPCFHDESLAHLKIWPRLYGEAAGILYHSVEEQEFAQTQLGVNHPNAQVIGAYLHSEEAHVSSKLPDDLQRPYVVYCGRYSEQKNVTLLIKWFCRYREEHGGPVDIVFMGQGEVCFPKVPWLRDLGRVDEATKRAVLANAKALVQLSRQESLSLVVLEAWAAGTPVIVHRDCAVLAGQIGRSQGGIAISGYAQFAGALDDLLRNEAAWRRRGAAGRAYFRSNYGDARDYGSRLQRILDNATRPIGELMRERGRARAQLFARQRWQQRFADFVENMLSQPYRRRHDDVRVEPLRTTIRTSGDHALLLPVRFCNRGTHAAAPDGPGRSVVCCEIRAALADAIVVPCVESTLPNLLMPGQSQSAALPIEVPMEEGAYRVRLWTESPTGCGAAHAVEVLLHVDAAAATSNEGCVSTFLHTIARMLPAAHRLQQLPADYVDVTEGTLAPVKRFIKRKMLHNFKSAYVDVLSRQQSQVNAHLVLMIQQLAECCATLDHAVTALHEKRQTQTESSHDYAERRQHG